MLIFLILKKYLYILLMLILMVLFGKLVRRMEFLLTNYVLF